MMDKDPPIVEQEFLAGVKVVDIGDIRVARGLSRRVNSACPHQKLNYDPRERRIWCRDCEHNVDPFDAFERIVENFHKAASRLKRLETEVREAESYSLHLIACKNLEKIWRGSMIPVCPHCKQGLLAEDFRTVGFRISGEIEKQRRKRVKESNPNDRR